MLLLLMVAASSRATPLELKDSGEGLTGPQPSIVGSLDKVFNKVNKFDTNSCLQKMICEAMGGAESLVTGVVNSQLGGQVGQLAQGGINQLQNNPNQFVQTQLQPNSPFVQAATAQLPGGGQQLLQNGQQILSSGQQFLNSGQQFVQQFPLQGGQQQFQTSFGQQNQFQQNQFQQNQFQQNQFQQNQFQQNQFQPNQFQQNQFAPQNQFGQNQFHHNVPNQFSQGQQSSGGEGGFVDSLVDGLAGALAHIPLGRRKRQTSSTMHGQAIRMMHSLGLNNMGAFPYVRAAIIGHANKDAAGSCRQLYRDCPDGTDQLLSYFNNHNGGLGQSVVPSVTNEVGSLFPGLASLPQVAASVAGEFVGSGSSGGQGGIVNTVVDTLAGFIAGATLPKPSGKEAKKGEE